MNAYPMCCGSVCSYVDNVPGKEYYFCRECRNEVLAAPNIEEYDYASAIGSFVYDKARTTLFNFSSGRLPVNRCTNKYGNIVAGPSPWDVIVPDFGAQKNFFDTETVAEVVRSSIYDIFVEQVFESFRYHPIVNPCFEIVSVDRQTGTVTMKVVAEPLEDEEEDEPFDY